CPSRGPPPPQPYPLSLHDALPISLVGLLLGAELNELIPNLDFALTALFVILAYEQYNSNRQAWPIYMAIAVFAAMHLIMPDYALLLTIITCAILIMLRAKKNEQ